MTKADSPTKLCAEVDCGRPLRARGLCVTHYNQQKQSGRHKTVSMPCTWCEKPCAKEPTRGKRYSAMFCGYECGSAWRASTGIGGMTDEGKAKGVAARMARPRRESKVRLRALLPIASCARCDAPFQPRRVGAKYCAWQCRVRAKTDAARERARGREYGGWTPRSIFERDSWRCHLCAKPVMRDATVPHPLAPTIDHLIPVSMGGLDQPWNVACAHFICNSTRRDVGPAQLLLFG